MASVRWHRSRADRGGVLLVPALPAVEGQIGQGLRSIQFVLVMKHPAISARCRGIVGEHQLALTVAAAVLLPESTRFITVTWNNLEYAHLVEFHSM